MSTVTFLLSSEFCCLEGTFLFKGEGDEDNDGESNEDERVLNFLSLGWFVVVIAVVKSFSSVLFSERCCDSLLRVVISSAMFVGLRMKEFCFFTAFFCIAFDFAREFF
jgi:hypothetical protein